MPKPPVTQWRARQRIRACQLKVKKAKNAPKCMLIIKIDEIHLIFFLD
jgi:hypothetical protein